MNDDKLRICTKREIGWLLVRWNAMGKTDGGGMGWGLFNRLLIGNVSRRACTEKEGGREREAAGRLERRREDDGTMKARSEGRVENRTSALVRTDRWPLVSTTVSVEKLANWENCFPFEPRRDSPPYVLRPSPLIAALT